MMHLKPEQHPFISHSTPFWQD